MNVHVSIDDVILSFKDLFENEPESVFDIPFFQYLWRCHCRYGVKFSLYSFARYDSFLISQVPRRYWKELIGSVSWLKFGFHGVYEKKGFELFSQLCDLFYSVIPAELQTSMLRLDRYSCTKEELKKLKSYGIAELLCRDEESRRCLQAPPSYDLSEIEFQSLSEGVFMKNGFAYRKTNIQVELYDEYELRKRLEEEIEKMDKNSILALFTHEWELPEKEGLMNVAFKILAERSVEYVL